MAKILILGGSGFLGRSLIAHLAARGHVIHAVIRSEESALRVRSACAEAATLAAADVAGERYERLINLVVDYGRGGTPLSSLIHTNLLYPLEIIERADTAAVLNVSSALPETYSDYAFSKKMLERSLDRLAVRQGFRNLNVHLHNMYGPGSDESNLVSALIGRMRRSEPVELSSCRNSRDFIYIDDVADALEILCAQMDQVPDVPAIEIGSGRATRLSDLVGIIQAKTGSSAPILYGARPDNPLEPPALAADLSALSAIGWTPAWSLDRGIDATIRFMAGEAPPTGC